MGHLNRNFQPPRSNTHAAPHNALHVTPRHMPASRNFHTNTSHQPCTGISSPVPLSWDATLIPKPAQGFFRVHHTNTEKKYHTHQDQKWSWGIKQRLTLPQPPMRPLFQEQIWPWGKEPRSSRYLIQTTAGPHRCFHVYPLFEELRWASLPWVSLPWCFSWKRSYLVL